MSSLVKLTINGYEDAGYQEPKKKGTFEVQVNPASIKLTSSTHYKNSQELGEKQDPHFSMQEPSKLNFDVILDDTGLIPSKKGQIKDRINQLEDVLYSINGESHQPNYIQVVWGTLTFYGRLTSLNYDYSLFKPDGSPLRVKISFDFQGYRQRKKKEKKSPDLSRIITVKAGESLPLLCEEFYDDPSYCYEVAQINNLSSFRNIKPGMRLLFPSIINYDSSI